MQPSTVCCRRCSHYAGKKERNMLIRCNNFEFSGYFSNIEAHLNFRFYVKLSVGVHVSSHVFSFVGGWNFVGGKFYFKFPTLGGFKSLENCTLFLPQQKSSEVIRDTLILTLSRVNELHNFLRNRWNIRNRREICLCVNWTSQFVRLGRTRHNKNKTESDIGRKKEETKYKQSIQMVIYS